MLDKNQIISFLRGSILDSTSSIYEGNCYIQYKIDEKSYKLIKNRYGNNTTPYGAIINRSLLSRKSINLDKSIMWKLIKSRIFINHSPIGCEVTYTLNPTVDVGYISHSMYVDLCKLVREFKIENIME